MLKLSHSAAQWRLAQHCKSAIKKKKLSYGALGSWPQEGEEVIPHRKGLGPRSPAAQEK